jgi:hypothetical protein
MNLSHFFVDRPIFATVLSVFLIIVGAAAFLPVAQYPNSTSDDCRHRVIPALPLKWSAIRSQRRSSRKSTASRTCST